MSQTIQISDESASLLLRQAAQNGLTVEAWVERLAHEQAALLRVSSSTEAREAAEELIALQREVKPDPEGWTNRDYIAYGRR
jgi:metal-responsive CopG/Arc/MetJ family transcriptional regulator